MPAGRVPRVDVHVHLSRWWPDIRETGYRPDLDYTIAGLLREMDANSVSDAIAIQLFNAESGDAALEEGRGWFEASRGRVHPVATVDPTKGENHIQATLLRWDREEHLVGIKLFPGYLPFYPHDPRLAPVYEYAHRRNLPVMVHQGDTLDRKGLVKFARPIELDEVAVRYRDVRFVLCHLANPWVEEAAEVIYKNENVWADTSGLVAPPTTPYFERMVKLCRERVYHAIVMVGSADRFLYGSDWPLESLELAASLVDGLDLPLADRNAILGANARRLFRLGEPPAAPAARS